MIHEHGNFFVIEQELDSARPDDRHKLAEVRDRKTELVKEKYLESLKVRGVHVGKKCFQVNTNTPDRNEEKIGKCGVSYDRHTQQLSLDLTIGNRGGKVYHETLQLR